MINDTKLGEDIPVGSGPNTLFLDSSRDAIYVTNFLSDSVSIIDVISNKVVGRVSFYVNPPQSGYIQCGEKVVPLQRSFYLDSGKSCTAIPNRGYEFLSWEENLGNNSTQMINVSKQASSIESLLDLLNTKTEEPESILNISRFGSFAANFKELPPAVPSEYWIPLYGIIASTIIGWSIPSIIGWTRSKADVRKLDHYHQRIKLLYDDGKLDENDVESLDKLSTDITDAYSKGRINEKHYENSKNEISIKYDKIFRKNIDSLKDMSKGSLSKQLNILKENIEIAHSEQKITETQFNLLNKKLLDLEHQDNHKGVKEK